MPKLTDSDIITFGIHVGKKLIDVPAKYLIFLFDNNKCNKELRAYIKDNMNVLRDEIRREEMKRQNYFDRIPEERRGRD